MSEDSPITAENVISMMVHASKMEVERGFDGGVKFPPECERFIPDFLAKGWIERLGDYYYPTEAGKLAAKEIQWLQ